MGGWLHKIRAGMASTDTPPHEQDLESQTILEQKESSTESDHGRQTRKDQVVEENQKERDISQVSSHPERIADSRENRAGTTGLSRDSDQSQPRP